jgi:hypothetical protein
MASTPRFDQPFEQRARRFVQSWMGDKSDAKAGRSRDLIAWVKSWHGKKAGGLAEHHQLGPYELQIVLCALLGPRSGGGAGRDFGDA